MAAPFRVLFQQGHLGPAANVADKDIAEVSAEQGQRQGMTTELHRGGEQFFLLASHPEVLQQGSSCLGRQAFQVQLHGPRGQPFQVDDRHPRGNQAQSWVVRRQVPEQGAEASILEPSAAAAVLGKGRVLQGLQTVEDQQRPPGANQVG